MTINIGITVPYALCKTYSEKNIQILHQSLEKYRSK